MGAVVDLTGKVFGKLTVLWQVETIGQTRWFCTCACGGSITVYAYNLVRKKSPTISCGCKRSRNATTHGMRYTKEYRAWRKMLGRCHDKKDNSYKYYGKRGIVVCDEWRKDFAAFFAHIGLAPSALHSVDRIKVDLNYEPGNVRWATRSQQDANKRPRSRRLKPLPKALKRRKKK